jgi:hypothetical protein
MFLDVVCHWKELCFLPKSHLGVGMDLFLTWKLQSRCVRGKNRCEMLRSYLRTIATITTNIDKETLDIEVSLTSRKIHTWYLHNIVPIHGMNLW